MEKEDESTEVERRVHSRRESDEWIRIGFREANAQLVNFTEEVRDLKLSLIKIQDILKATLKEALPHGTTIADHRLEHEKLEKFQKDLEIAQEDRNKLIRDIKAKIILGAVWAGGVFLASILGAGVVAQFEKFVSTAGIKINVDNTGNVKTVSPSAVTYIPAVTPATPASAAVPTNNPSAAPTIR